ASSRLSCFNYLLISGFVYSSDLAFQLSFDFWVAEMLLRDMFIGIGMFQLSFDFWATKFIADYLAQKMGAFQLSFDFWSWLGLKPG
ncbi:MAG: hypothetical protein ACP5H5_10505, partial [Pyrobaculum sp.]